MEEATRISRHWLRYHAPRGPWVLTAIPPNGGKVTTQYFTPEKESDMLRWIESKNGKFNVYFMVNTPRGILKDKAKKTDVEELSWLHVDIDPEKGKSFEAEQKRIKKLIDDFEPKPSAVIFSGGGYQAFWRLDEPVFVGGDLGAVEELEQYNIQLATLLGGDSCHNLDRIMRLPGTINIPGEKKRKAGRVEVMADLVYSEELDHPLSAFVKAPRIQTPDGEGIKVELSGNLPPVDLDTLPEAVTPRTRMLIVQGDDPDDPTKYGSRSEVTFAVTCMLVRALVDDDVIASILLDEDFGISEHCRAQKRPRGYTARQIQRAKEEVEEPWLRRLNHDHAVIEDIGGKCRTISEVYDPTLRRSRLSRQSFEDFRNRYMHQKVQVGTDKDSGALYMPAGKWWLQHPMRRQYKTIIFAPNQEVPGAYNLWRGFNCDAVPGDCGLFLKHMKNIICDGNEEYYEYLLYWMARAVQFPDTAGEVAIVLRGGMGSGKGTFVNAFGQLWGRHFLQISNSKHLVGQFNSHLRDCVVLFADEAFFAGDKAHEGILRALITESTIMVEGKGVDAEIAPNYTHILMASNSVWVVPAGSDERRYFVLDVSDDKKQDTAYFGAMRKQLSQGGFKALLHYLLSIDLTEFNVRDVPKTSALREQKLLSLSLEEQWWFERLMDGRITTVVYS